MKKKIINFKKIVYYILLLAINISAFLLIGIAFLNGPPILEQSELANRSIIYKVSPFARFGLYAIIVSLVFSVSAYVLSFLFKKSINMQNHTLRRVLFAEFLFFMLSSLIIYLYIYMIHQLERNVVNMIMVQGSMIRWWGGLIRQTHLLSICGGSVLTVMHSIIR